MMMLLMLFSDLSYATDLECNKVQSSDQVYLCSKQSLEASDKKLNQEYRELLKSVSVQYSSHERLKDEFIKKIKISQRSWIDFRDKNCEVLSYQIDVGTHAYETSINLCKDKMTQERSKELGLILN
ncbi:lysozyme inhibitor LprI family protein [Enterobacter ludwigii]|nr:lysozyme inhibitor LprI family protein [Enterobacter ludwigii]